MPAYEELYDRRYFDSDDQTKGYCGEGYRDFACHYYTAHEIVKRAPKSVLDVGGARGYVAKIVAAAGIKTAVMDVSRHCYHTRVVDAFYPWDLTKTPWKDTIHGGKGSKRSIPDEAFDMCFSIATLEHVPKNVLPDVIREMARVSDRGFHGVLVGNAPVVPGLGHGGEDPTHEINESKEWWEQQFKDAAPDYPVEIVDKEALELGSRQDELANYLPQAEREPSGRWYDKKINMGCFTNMFYYGWLNTDIVDGLDTFAIKQAYNYMRVDATKPLPFPDGYADLIFTSHMIEHLSRPEGIQFVRECYRILRSGGLLRIAAPDTARLMEMYLYDRKSTTSDLDHPMSLAQFRHVNTGVEQSRSALDAFAHLALTHHKSVYDEYILIDEMTKAGFRKTKAMTPFTSMSELMQRETYVSHPTLSLVVEGLK